MLSLACDRSFGNLSSSYVPFGLMTHPFPLRLRLAAHLGPFLAGPIARNARWASTAPPGAHVRAEKNSGAGAGAGSGRVSGKEGGAWR